MPRRVVSTSGSSGKAKVRVLFDFSFGVDDVLTDYRIEFLQLELIGHRALVLIGRIVVASSGARY